MQKNYNYCYRTKTSHSCKNLLPHFLFEKIDSEWSTLSQLLITQTIERFVFLITQPKKAELLRTGL